MAVPRRDLPDHGPTHRSRGRGGVWIIGRLTRTGDGAENRPTSGRFKQVTTLSPIRFGMGIRLNGAAMRMAGGMTVDEAATEVGDASSSQFSREFKRMYGQSPKQWSSTRQPLTAGLT
ncbi:MAG: AraC family transcriptional regulator [Ilumatobacteraceae bacterium]|nr:AraC family transcriptional regulator [Ilumatobacteraceae bacterium]